jgi:hypothetical protein
VSATVWGVFTVDPPDGVWPITVVGVPLEQGMLEGVRPGTDEMAASAPASESPITEGTVAVAAVVGVVVGGTVVVVVVGHGPVEITMLTGVWGGTIAPPPGL